MSEGLKINDKNQEFLAESVPIINLYEGDRRNTIQSSLCSKWYLYTLICIELSDRPCRVNFTFMSKKVVNHLSVETNLVLTCLIQSNRLTVLTLLKDLRSCNLQMFQQLLYFNDATFKTFTYQQYLIITKFLNLCYLF